MASGKPYKDFTGRRVATWIVVEEAGFGDGECMQWRARCDCGAERSVLSNAMSKWKGFCKCTGGRPDGTHPLYGTWANMKHRCHNEKNSNYSRYGGRGIKVCGRWLGRNGFINFLADVGPRPDGMTLDRVNPNGNYEPSNVRWATAKEQSHNQRLSRQRVIGLLDMVEEIISEHPATTADVLLKVLRKQLLGSAT